MCVSGRQPVYAKDFPVNIPASTTVNQRVSEYSVCEFCTTNKQKVAVVVVRLLLQRKRYEENAMDESFRSFRLLADGGFVRRHTRSIHRRSQNGFCVSSLHLRLPEHRRLSRRQREREGGACCASCQWLVSSTATGSVATVIQGHTERNASNKRAQGVDAIIKRRERARVMRKRGGWCS